MAAVGWSVLRCATSFSGFILRRNARQLSPLIYRQNTFHQTHVVSLHAKYGGRNTVTLIPGDGVGPEMVTAVKDIFRYIGAPVDFEELNLSGLNLSDEDTFSDTLEDVVTSVKRNGAAIKGNIFTPLDQPTFKSLNVELRLQLDLFANVVRCKSIPGIPVRHDDVDLVIIRENTEGEYSHIEHENVDGVIESFKIMTEEKCTKVAKYAFDFAVKHGRKKVTAVHKANIMKLGDGLFLRCCGEVSKSYPDIEFNSMIIDNCCMQLVSNPEQFDVMVMPNLYGNIVSNIGASLVGGPGIVPGENIGGDYAVFESGSRHTGLDIKGKNLSNPMSLLFASTLMLEHLGWNAYGDMIHSAILRVVQKGVKTADIGGGHLTTDFLECLKEEIGQMSSIVGLE
ncbi:isocitrate dehydrogenase [NAD] subunit gamma, mitochondrial-like isoform X1 [Stylophora pistillata]|uniref:Isocitrate dehydrogenase [NAD] subunit, mitochondrial n=2 Tax=Stylophora pistillata TaxID=50429 RepID=A0A2B4S518_STYPI|nr:isocitrate dehydrogenase [NAD] subunit gamma, mitochondrial-like isoform X1 [Stylophora pistillata]PFX23565.1 Isocitrate dehydrogenase [NAD] subunit gamma 1, mitochondrial [Stylophora pistillata]